MAGLHFVIKSPVMTEKSSADTEAFNRYAFLVDRKADKQQVKVAIENLFNVKVEKVWTSVRPGKLRRRGRYVHKTGATKKAIVQVKEGQKIELFKGV